MVHIDNFNMYTVWQVNVSPCNWLTILYSRLKCTFHNFKF